MTSLSLRAPAKINLGLRVLGLREDGYHELRTCFQSIDLADHLILDAQAEGLALEVEGADLPVDSTNLVLRAAEALAAGRKTMGARIRLHKQIPVAAGLGGGSSDAAAALLGLNRLWGLNLPAQDLHGVAISLGADVAFFLVGGFALGLGRGDEITPLEDTPPFRIALILPPLACSTAEMYRAWDRKHPGLNPPARGSTREPILAGVRGSGEAFAVHDLHNDLEEIALSMHPQLGEYRSALLGAGARAVSLSGSGPTLYGIFSSSEEIGWLRDSRDWGATRVLECAPLGRRAYGAMVGLSLSD